MDNQSRERVAKELDELANDPIFGLKPSINATYAVTDYILKEVEKAREEGRQESWDYPKRAIELAEARGMKKAAIMMTKKSCDCKLCRKGRKIIEEANKTLEAEGD